MYNNPESLFAAVKKAVGSELSIRRSNDRLMVQKGCYILNRWGHGPEYRYDLYVRGPYSSELADDYYELKGFVGEETDIPADAIDRLSDIMRKGVRYTEAYATALLVKTVNPDRTDEEVYRKTVEIKPHLKKEVEEALAALTA